MWEGHRRGMLQYFPQRLSWGSSFRLSLRGRLEVGRFAQSSPLSVGGALEPPLTFLFFTKSKGSESECCHPLAPVASAPVLRGCQRSPSSLSGCLQKQAADSPVPRPPPAPCCSSPHPLLLLLPHLLPRTGQSGMTPCPMDP